MIPSDLHHGSPEMELIEILPGKRKGSNHMKTVFASTHIEVALMFTLSPDTVEFMVDPIRRRIFVPDEREFIGRDRGGAIYKVEGEFWEAADKLIFEYEAPRARVIFSTPIDSATRKLTELGFEIYADPMTYDKMEIYLGEHRGFPELINKRIKPINR